MNTNFRNKKTSMNPINGRKTIISKSKINLKNEYSANNKVNSAHRNTTSLGNFSLSNGKINTLITPFSPTQENIEEQEDSASSLNNNYDKVLMKIPKKRKKKNEDLTLFNREEFNDNLVEFMSKKLENLSKILKNSEATYQEVITTQDTLSRFDEDIPDSYFYKTYENNDEEYVKEDLDENKYIPYTNEEKEKILQELESEAIKRHTTYFGLLGNLNNEIKETLHFAYTFNEENINLGISDPNELITKDSEFKRLESSHIDPLETEMYPTNYTKETSVVVNEKSELNRKSRLKTVVKPNTTPKKNTHANDLKKRLNNLKSDGKPNLQIRTLNKQKSTAEKLIVVKKMGKTNLQRTMTISRGSKKIPEHDSSFANKEGITTNQMQIPITKFSSPRNESIKTERISNGALVSSNDIGDQVNPRKRFNTQAKPKRKTQEIKKHEWILKINDNNESKERLTLNNVDITGMKKSIATLMVPNSSADENKLDIGKNKTRSNTVRFNLQGNSQSKGAPIFNQNTSSPMMSEFKSEEPVHEFRFGLKEEGEAKPQTKSSEIKYIFKSIILKDNTEKDSSNVSPYADGINLPQKSLNKNSLAINTIDSVPCQDNSDSETPVPLNYFTLDEESVIHKFPVLCFHTNNESNDSSMIMGRNRKNKLEKILIHANSGKRIKSDVALESFDNQENSDEVGPFSFCQSKCSIL